MHRPNAPTATILVIDPDPITTLGIAAVLDLQGYQCHYACDQEAAKRAAKALPLDLIICDMDIPQGGPALRDELVALADIRDVPVIYLADGPPTERPVDGSTFWLIKPFDPEMLTDMASKALWMPHLIQSRLRHAHGANASVIPAPVAGRRATTDQRRSSH